MTNREKSVEYFVCWFGFFAYTNITIDKVFEETCKKNDSGIYVRLRKMFLKDFGY